MYQGFSGLFACRKIAIKMREIGQKSAQNQKCQKEKSLENVVFSRLFGGGGSGIRTHVRLPSNGFQGTLTTRKLENFRG